MNFSATLNYYLELIDCSAKDLALASNVSEAAISRYRAGERIPDFDGKHISSLADGIANLSGGKLRYEDVHRQLMLAISGLSVDYETFIANLNALLVTAKISSSDLARLMSFDPSFVSRMLAGQRRPGDLRDFASNAAEMIAKRALANGNATAVKSLVNADTQQTQCPDEQLGDAILMWLSTNHAPLSSAVGGFLGRLDAFELSDFIRSIHFDEMQVPSVPMQLPTTKTYSGIAEMKNCEIDFLKAVVLAKSSADVIMFSDMPLAEMASDPEFPKKWMYGMGLLLKRGLHLHIIHDTARPLGEMMLGLEGWIPMYMTGQVSPYYFDPPQTSNVFCHILKVGGTAAMSGEAIAGSQREGRYVLTKKRDEVRYYRRRAQAMLKKARPLMRIWTERDSAKLAEFERACCDGGNWRMIVSTLPIGSIPEDLLERMLIESGVSNADQTRIHEFVERRKASLHSLLENGAVTFELPEYSKEEFETAPPTLDLAGMFYSDSISYTAEQYQEHLESLRGLVSGYDASKVRVDKTEPFRNIQIRIREGDFVVVSKNKDPHIHFLIEHPEMIAAFEQFSAPVIEDL